MEGGVGGWMSISYCEMLGLRLGYNCLKTFLENGDLDLYFLYSSAYYIYITIFGECSTNNPTVQQSNYSIDRKPAGCRASRDIR